MCGFRCSLNNAIRRVAAPLTLYANASPSGFIGSAEVIVSATISGLAPATIYYFQAVATVPSTGVTVLGDVYSFTTRANGLAVPLTATLAPLLTVDSGATVAGTVNPNLSGEATTAFEYATTVSGFVANVSTFVGALTLPGDNDGIGAASRFYTPQVRCL